MPRDLILGTAGHIDHGKTSLVKALTGIDCDRLPEEKERGITIDIGFAHLDLGGFRLGIVDVPGHERFIKNMLAGATGIDIALLVVAADDSVMPQTREHLEILKLLGVRHGMVALTKADLVDETTREVVSLEIRELLRGSFLKDAPIIPTSAVTGLGLDRVKAEIIAAAGKIERGDDLGAFRLPIDRSFVVQGHGTVVTGSVASGSAKAGDELDWHKGDGTIEKVRIRAVSNHGVAVAEVHRGQRAGVNLAGIPHEAVRRGQELCTPGYLVPGRVLTVRLFASAEFRRPIKHRLPLRVHVATAEVMGAVSLLDCDHVDPGQWAIAQLFVEEPVTTIWGQAFVLRDASAEHTLGGGQVLQPAATKIRRRHIEALENLERLASARPEERTLAAAWFAEFSGLAPNDLVRTAGITAPTIAALSQKLVASSQLAELTLPGGRKLLLHAERVAELEKRLLDALGAFHSENPLATVHDRQKVLARLDYIGDDSLLQGVTDRLIATKKVVGDSRAIARADFKPKLSANQRKLKDRI
ncbi:MAG TPA: selenocysteine-specific translation elongation factor, partial [Gemmata sp.]|nr:selenocysteine-specific translation elongation factor [Gemmata sp.]